MESVRRCLLALLPLCCAGSGCQFDGSTRTEGANAPQTDAQIVAAADAIPAVRDGAEPGDAAVGPDASAPIHIQLNIAGAEHVGTDYPGTWRSDPGVGGVCTPFYYTNTSSVDGTVDDALFTDVAYGSPLLCNVGGGQLPPGSYRVRLLFAEIYFGSNCPGNGGTGNRVFDIALEGSVVQSDLDVFALAGCTENGGSPYVAAYELEITDGTLSISMPASADNAMISAIEVQSLW